MTGIGLRVVPAPLVISRPGRVETVASMRFIPDTGKKRKKVNGVVNHRRQISSIFHGCKFRVFGEVSGRDGALVPAAGAFVCGGLNAERKSPC